MKILSVLAITLLVGCSHPVDSGERPKPSEPPSPSQRTPAIAGPMPAEHLTECERLARDAGQPVCQGS